MAYPIATMADGTILYSDGTKKSPASGYGSQYQNDLSQEQYPASGYGSEFQNNLYVQDPSGSNNPSIGNGNSNNSGSIRTQWNGQWYNSQGDAAKAQQDQARQQQIRAEQERQQQEQEYNRFQQMVGSFIQPNSIAYAGDQNFTPQTSQSGAHDSGIFGDIMRGMGFEKDWGISEMFGGNMKSLESQGRELSPFQSGMRMASRMVPATYAISGADKFMGNLASGAYTSQPQIQGVATSAGSNVGTTGSADTSTAPSTEGYAGDGSTQNPFENAGTSAPQHTPGTGTGTQENGYTFNGTEWVKDQAQPTDLEQQIQDLYMLFDEEGTQSAANADTQMAYVGDSAENQANQLQIAYDQIMANYDKLEGDAKTQADATLQEIKDTLDIFKDKGAAGKQSITNTYGDLIRRTSKAGQMNQNKLRNIFSSLGTAESSSFIENMTNLEQERGRGIRNIETERASKMTGIDTEILDQQKWADRETTRIRDKKDEYIKYIGESRLLDADKKAALIQQVNQGAAAQMASVISSWQNAALQLKYRMSQFGDLLTQANTPSDSLTSDIAAMQNPLYMNQNRGFSGQMPSTYDTGQGEGLDRFTYQSPQYAELLKALSQ